MQSNLAQCHKRLQKELEDLEKYKDQLSVTVDTNNKIVWKIIFKGADNTLYAGEEYTLQFKFSPEFVDYNNIAYR
jgi:ubiquitin-protein ligase